MVAKRRIMEQWKRGAHGNTYGGNPLACAAANATLDLVNGGLAANAAAVGTHFTGRLRELARNYPCIGDVRGRGLMIGIELIGPQPDRPPARALTDKVIERAYHNGLLLLSCGVSTVRFMPPLNVTAAQVDEAVGLLKTSLDEALALVGK
jgi:4-aminobutyrate aminotransferase